jgi:tetratricopeptide (TPR) repeat protein
MLMLQLLGKWWLEAIASTAIVLGGKRRALEIYETIVNRHPRDERALATVGNLRMELGDKQGAIRAFEALLAVNARNAAAWFNLGFIHDHNEANADAERCFRAAVEIDPLLDRAWYGLGLVLIRQRRLAEAVVALKRNTKLQPFSPYGWYQLAMTYHHLGESVDALRIHDEMLRFEPHFAATLKRDLEQTQPQAARASTPGPVSTDASMKEAITTP